MKIAQLEAPADASLPVPVALSIGITYTVIATLTVPFIRAGHYRYKNPKDGRHDLRRRQMPGSAGREE
jgi:hypothetical protein